MFKRILRRAGILKEVKIYRRLLTLYRYITLFDLDTDRLKLLETGCNEFLVEFKSNLGTVRVGLRYYEDNCEICMDYSNYAGSMVFYIDTYDSHIKELAPRLDGDLTAKDIDLAIYELEEYLRNTYGSIEEALETCNKAKKYFQKLHEQGIKELEG